MEGGFVMDVKLGTETYNPKNMDADTKTAVERRKDVEKLFEETAGHLDESKMTKENCMDINNYMSSTKVYGFRIMVKMKKILSMFWAQSTRFWTDIYVQMFV